MRTRFGGGLVAILLLATAILGVSAHQPADARADLFCDLLKVNCPAPTPAPPTETPQPAAPSVWCVLLGVGCPAPAAPPAESPQAAAPSVWCTLLRLGCPGGTDSLPPVIAEDPGGDPDASVPSPPPAGKFLGISGDAADNNILDSSLPPLESDAIRTAGATMQRIVLLWSTYEPYMPDANDDHKSTTYCATPTRCHHYNAAYVKSLDERLAAARNGGDHPLRPLLQVGSAPQWATWFHNCRGAQNSLGYPCDFGVPPSASHLADLRDFAQFLSDRYDESNPVFEVWNEPNLLVAFQGGIDPAFYTDIVKAVYDGVRANHPERLVLAGTVSPNETYTDCNGSQCSMPFKDFLDRMYSAGWRSKAPKAELSIHAYPDGVGTAGFGVNTFWARQFRDLRWVLNKYNDTGQGIWVTETAPTQPRTSIGEPNDGLHRDAVRETYRRLMTMDTKKVPVAPGQNFGLNVRGVFPFVLNPNLGGDPAKTFGLLRNWNDPRPAFCWYVKNEDPSKPHDPVRTYPGC